MLELIEKNGKYYQELEVLMLSEKNVTKIERNQLWTHNNGGNTSLRIWNSPTEYVKPYELNGYCIPKNLHLTSKEKPKKGDWIIRKNHQRPVLMGDDLTLKGDNKIIATTDFNLKTFVDSEDGNYTVYGKGYFKELPNIPIDFIQSFTDSYNKGNIITKVLVEVNTKSVLSNGCEALGFVKDFKSYKIKNGAIIIEKIEDKVYTEEEIIFGVRKMLSSENIKFHYVREELPKFLEEAKNEIISFKTNLKK